MTPQEISNLYSSPDEHNSIEYLKKEGLYDLINSLNSKSQERIAPKYNDLARLHNVIRSRKVFTVLEFGLGFSTIIMADALKKNKKDWNSIAVRPNFRNSMMFKLFSVDASETWIQKTKEMIPSDLLEFIEIQYSAVSITTFNCRYCHIYDQMPNIIPDFIYLDGPSPFNVSGTKNGIDWNNPDRVVLSADILVIEPMLLPGTLIIVDGRTTNARFLVNNFQRNWDYSYNIGSDISTFELLENPIGEINYSTIEYCLGNNFFSRLKTCI